MRSATFLITIFTLLIACTDKEHRKQQFLLKGNEAYKKQHYNQAINYYEEAIKTDSCYAPALNNLGTLYYTQRNLDKALHLYEQAIDCDPSFYQAYINLSNTLYDLKQYYRGMEVLSPQIGAYPDSVDLLFGMGLHLTKLREYDSALAVFRKVREKQPENEEILVNIGTLNYYKQNFEEAKKLLTEAVEINPEAPEAYNTLSLIAAEEGDYEQALQNINIAIGLDEEAHYLNNKGYILIKLERLEEAREIINESITIDPFNGWAYRNKAILNLKQDKPREAIRLLERAGKLEDWIESLNFYLGEAYRQLDEKTKACSYYYKGVEKKENKAEEAVKKYCQ
ncbi:MAG: tetratricopeptide repeat protein [Candidatus Cyclobacteriaceae bacterium M2_1C_046]